MMMAPSARVQARALAARLAVRLRRTGGVLAAPGGTTPAALFDALARQDAGWRRVTVTLTDERWVSPRAAGSNEWQVRAHLLQAQARAAGFLPLKTSHPRALDAAGAVAAQLAKAGPLQICVLGMGEDGHIASLFPGTAPTRKAVLAVSARGAAGSAERLSLSLRTILAARLVVIFIRGREKLSALKHWLSASAPETPIRTLVEARRGPIWLSWAP